MIRLGKPLVVDTKDQLISWLFDWPSFLFFLFFEEELLWLVCLVVVALLDKKRGIPTVVVVS